MKLPCDLSGAELAQALCKHFGYRCVHKEGSHIILQMELPSHHRLSIPDHSPLRVGTLNAILRAGAQAKRIEKETVLEKL